jgi:hypothetical protein
MPIPDHAPEALATAAKALQIMLGRAESMSGYIRAHGVPIDLLDEYIALARLPAEEVVAAIAAHGEKVNRMEIELRQWLWQRVRDARDQLRQLDGVIGRHAARLARTHRTVQPLRR